MSPVLETFIQQSITRIDKTLAAVIEKQKDNSSPNNSLLAAMRYSLLSNGKRFRPCLAYAAALAVDIRGGKIDGEIRSSFGESTDKTASALEMVHAYSLIHDDLPAMDNDELRRGQATCHIAFDEATAILAGDALQSLAFEQLSSIQTLKPSQVLHLVSVLAKAIGPTGMVLGQAIDLSATGEVLQQPQLQAMHRRKTGDLIVASSVMGARSTGCDDMTTLTALATYGEHLGLAFQIQDDLLDAESDTDTLGKTSGADQNLNKSTYTSILGIEGARQALMQTHQLSLAALADFGSSASLLRDIADHTINRKF